MLSWSLSNCWSHRLWSISFYILNCLWPCIRSQLKIRWIIDEWLIEFILTIPKVQMLFKLRHSLSLYDEWYFIRKIYKLKESKYCRYENECLSSVCLHHGLVASVDSWMASGSLLDENDVFTVARAGSSSTRGNQCSSYAGFTGSWRHTGAGAASARRGGGVEGALTTQVTQ